MVDSKKPSVVPFYLVFTLLSGLVLYLTLQPAAVSEHQKSPAAQNARLMEVEERENVVLVLDQLEAEFPNLSSNIREVRVRVLERPMWIVDNDLADANLVWNHTEGLIFSVRFFNVDHFTQSNILLKLIAPRQSQWQSKPMLNVEHSES